ncbi:hypothetical protein ACKKBG_A01580 [Auxenochlorella protothecoides x Auxenochlorella symbiontica]
MRAWWARRRRAEECGAGEEEGAPVGCFGGRASEPRAARRAEEEDGSCGPLVSPRRLFMEASAAAEAVEGADGTPSPRPGRGGEGGEGIEREASQRMEEVEAAVRAAEADEWASEGGAPVVPSVIPPGSYGGGAAPGGAAGRAPSSSTSSSVREHLRWRRALYPAGRILHLVPARLVPLDEAGFEVLFPERRAGQAAHAEEGAGGVGGEGGGESGDGPDPTPRGRGRAGETDARASPAGPDDADAAARSPSPDPFSAGPALASTSPPGCLTPPRPEDLPPKTGATATNPAFRAVQPREPMMLLEAVPQTMYGRIRLCRDVLSDHIIPNYLASLDSALERLPPAFHPECVARAVHAPAWDPPVQEGEGCGLPETVGVPEPLMA